MYPPIIWLALGSVFFIGLLLTRLGRIRLVAAGIAAASLGCLLAFACVARSLHVPDASTVDTYADSTRHVITGRVVAPPEYRGGAMRYVVEAETVSVTDAILPVRGKVLVTDRGAWPRMRYGDTVRASGILSRPGMIEDFRYDRYLAVSRVYSVLDRATVTVQGPNRGNAFLATLYGFRESLEARIATLYPEPHGALLAGLLVGSRAGFPESVQEALRRAGLTHLVAISGANITMLLACAGPLLKRFPWGWRLIPSLLLVASFTLLTGASASVTRAAIMGGLGLLAVELDRKRDVRLAMLWTAAVMTGLNPGSLWDDAGFHLSFLALLGLVELSPLTEPVVRRVPERFGLRESLQSTLAAQLGTAPWGMHLFGSVSLVAPLANLLAPVAVPWAMLLGTAGLVMDLVIPLLAPFVVLVATLPLGWILGVARTLGPLPLAAADLSLSGPVAAAISVAVFGAPPALRLLTRRTGGSAPIPRATPPPAVAAGS